MLRISHTSPLNLPNLQTRNLKQHVWSFFLLLLEDTWIILDLLLLPLSVDSVHDLVHRTRANYILCIHRLVPWPLACVLGGKFSRHDNRVYSDGEQSSNLGCESSCDSFQLRRRSSSKYKQWLLTKVSWLDFSATLRHGTYNETPTSWEESADLERHSNLLWLRLWHRCLLLHTARNARWLHNTWLDCHLFKGKNAVKQ